MYEIDIENYQLIIGDKKIDFDIESYEDEKSLYVESDLKEIQGLQLTINDFPEKLFFDLHSSDGFGTYFFYELEVCKVDGNVVFLFRSNQPNKYWEGKWGLSTFLSGLSEIINDTTEAEVYSLDIENDYKEIEVKFICNSDFNFSDQIKIYSELLNQYIKNTERLLSGVIWRKEFETDEKLFCTELLYPLLRKMNFIDVRFTHGTREYGKDFTFSEITSFGNLRHYAIQAKAGNIRGNVKSEIDEIIGQLDDAFSMPYFEVSVNENRLINTFIVAISGNFTENAKDKISNKIPTNLKGSIYFLDREKILELIEKYWK